ncbi:MAG TPA: hypothetical protein VFC63_21170 [Blastocatellia bacterium]|nr:hypothetical protein [Blastocatellia bacterium]
MRKRIKTHIVVFRLDENQWEQLTKAALASGENPNDWCRRLTITELDLANGLSRNERLIFEEVTRIRFLLGNAFRLVANDKLTPEEWERLRKDAQENTPQYVKQVLNESRALRQTTQR